MYIFFFFFERARMTYRQKFSKKKKSLQIVFLNGEKILVQEIKNFFLLKFKEKRMLYLFFILIVIISIVGC